MKALMLAVAAGLCMALVSLAGHAQEMSFRKGVITGISPIQVQASQAAATQSGGSATGGAVGRMFGRALGRAVSKAAGEYSSEVSEIGNSLIADAGAGARSGGGGKTVTAYLVMVRFDNGSESAIQASSIENLRVGSKVNVVGSGSATQVMPAL